RLPLRPRSASANREKAVGGVESPAAPIAAPRGAASAFLADTGRASKRPGPAAAKVRLSVAPSANGVAAERIRFDIGEFLADRAAWWDSQRLDGPIISCRLQMQQMGLLGQLICNHSVPPREWRAIDFGLVVSTLVPTNRAQQ